MAAPDFQTEFLVFGVGGLDLLHPTDRISPSQLAIMTNVRRSIEGKLESRPGQSTISTAGTGLTHSVRRLNDPRAGIFSRIWGIGTELYHGSSNPVLAETGFSGNPFHLVPYRPPLSGDTWMFIGDSAKMRKIRVDGLDLPIGLTPPNTAAATALAAEFRTTIETFDSAAGWTSNAQSGSGGVPTVASVGGKVGNAVRFRTNPGTFTSGYYNFWNKSLSANLDSVGGQTAEDDDIIHLWVRTDSPGKVTEIKVYLVCSTAFTATVLPGQSTSQNTDAFVKVFRPSDFTPSILQDQSQIATSTAQRRTGGLDRSQSRGRFKDPEGGPDDRPTWAERRAAIETARAESEELIGGRGQWTEFGIIGVPLRRRDFLRIGTNDSRGWANITGMVVLAQTRDDSIVDIYLDDMYLTGGRDLDTSEPGSLQYDYRYRHYDPRTGAKSNPSPIQIEAVRLDSLRRAIDVTPFPTNDANLRQQIFRRGGSNVDDWYFLGTNASDGGVFTDTISDANALAAGGLELDNDKPVTTVNADGTTRLAQPVPVLFGPVQDLLLALGDPFRPGDVYWSKRGEPDHWPPGNHVEVCPPSEELMSGVVYGGQAYAFSLERLYALYPNLSSTGTVTSTPTSCRHGLISRWGVAVDYGQIFFVSNDGIYSTTGGAEVSITEGSIRGLFHGETINGYLPVDFTQPENIRLAVHDNEVWFQYIDTGGSRRVLVFSLIFNYWRAYSFSDGPATVYSDEGDTLRLIFGGVSGSAADHSGTSDKGTAIAVQVRTGSLDQSFPRQKKRYGDLILDADRASETITITVRTDNETATLSAITVNSGSGRLRYTLDPFVSTADPDSVLARNISLDLSWSSTANAPALFHGGPSFIVQPDTTVGRVTEWDAIGALTDKYIKGVMIECDTFGTAKTIEIQADGVTQTSLSVTASGRQILQFSFAQFQARLLRLRPTDANNWLLYRVHWIFDEEPASLLRWETQEIDHGIQAWQVPLYGHITLRSSRVVTLTLTAYRQDGTSQAVDYIIDDTGGTKRKVFLPFQAVKGIVFKYLFTSSQPFWLYREESTIFVRPWAGKEMLVHPFGNDDLDLVRDMRGAEAVASRPGGGG